MFDKTTKKAKKGQGIVEYAGALVVAAAIVAAVIGIGGEEISGFFQDTLSNLSFDAQ